MSQVVVVIGGGALSPRVVADVAPDATSADWNTYCGAFA